MLEVVSHTLVEYTLERQVRVERKGADFAGGRGSPIRPSEPRYDRLVELQPGERLVVRHLVERDVRAA